MTNDNDYDRTLVIKLPDKNSTDQLLTVLSSVLKKFGLELVPEETPQPETSGFLSELELCILYGTPQVFSAEDIDPDDDLSGEADA